MSVNWRNAASGRRTLIPHNFFNELRTQDTSRVRKNQFPYEKFFRTMLYWTPLLVDAAEPVEVFGGHPGPGEISLKAVVH